MSKEPFANQIESLIGYGTMLKLLSQWGVILMIGSAQPTSQYRQSNRLPSRDLGQSKSFAADTECRHDEKIQLPKWTGYRGSSSNPGHELARMSCSNLVNERGRVM
jgi:hypothetical protein